MTPPPVLPAAPLTAARILVVDDHRKIREPLATLLRRAGFDVRVADSAAAMRLLLRHETVDLVVLDVMLPDGDGFALCRELRADGGPAVILLTARGEAHDRIAGLQLGADDYVVKPFEPEELIARIHNVLRRSARAPVPPALPTPEHAAAEDLPRRHAFSDWLLDEDSATLAHADGRSAALTTTEARLLGVLVRRPRTVLSREELQQLTGSEASSSALDRTVDRQISRLRLKLEANPRQPVLLRTAWGGGYLLATTVTAA